MILTLSDDNDWESQKLSDAQDSQPYGPVSNDDKSGFVNPSSPGMYMDVFEDFSLLLHVR